MKRRTPAPDNESHMQIREALARAGLRNTLVRTSDGADGEPTGLTVVSLYAYDPDRDPSPQALAKLLPEGVAIEIVYEGIPMNAVWRRSGRPDPWDPREVMRKRR